MVDLRVGKFSLSLAWGANDNQADDLDNQVTQDSIKAETINKLINWIDGFRVDVEHIISKKQEDISSGKLYAHVSDIDVGIDIAELTREDLSALQPSLEALHDICQREAIALYLDGFDSLPRVHAGHFSCFDGNTVSIKNPAFDEINSKPAIHLHVRFDQFYNYYVNPYSKEQVERAFEKHGLSSPT